MKNAEYYSEPISMRRTITRTKLGIVGRTPLISCSETEDRIIRDYIHLVSPGETVSWQELSDRIEQVESGSYAIAYIRAFDVLGD